MPAWKADLFLMSIAVIWGAGFILTKVAFVTMGPLSYIGWRFILAWLVLLAIYRRRAIPKSFGEWRIGLLLGASLGLGYSFQNLGLQHMSSGKAGFLTSLYIILVPFLEAAFLGRQISRQVMLAVFVATCGLGFLSLNADLRLSTADLWVVLCALLFSAQILSITLFGRRYPTASLTFAQLFLASVITLGVAAVYEHPLQGFTPTVWASLIFTGALGTTLGFLIQMVAQPYTTATKAALIMALESPFAALFGWLWGNERLSPKEWLGCGLITLGIWIVEWKKREKRETGAVSSDDPAA
jgi:drug/metabolite transporter (DMT)-like permease